MITDASEGPGVGIAPARSCADVRHAVHPVGQAGQSIMRSDPDSQLFMRELHRDLLLFVRQANVGLQIVVFERLRPGQLHMQFFFGRDTVIRRIIPAFTINGFAGAEVPRPDAAVRGK